MYRCVYQHPDKVGKIGVELNRDLVKVAGRALTHNLTKLGPKVLPWSEKLLFAANWVARKTVGCKEYVPDFKQAFNHFCLHAGEPVCSLSTVCQQAQGNAVTDQAAMELRTLWLITSV